MASETRCAPPPVSCPPGATSSIFALGVEARDTQESVARRIKSGRPTIMLHRSRQSPTLMSVQTESFHAPVFSRLFRGQAWQALTIAFLVVTVTGAGLTGCSIEGSRKKRLLERIQPPQPVIAGTAVYGGGVLTVESWLGSSVRLKKTDEKAGAGEGRGHRGQRQSEAAAEESNSHERFDAPFEQGSNDYSPQEIDEMYGRANYEYVEPPVWR